MSIDEVRQRLLTIFNRLWEKAMPRIASLDLSEQEIRNYHDDSELMLLHYSDWFYKHHMPTPELSEARILSKNLMLMGVIDASLPDGDGVALVDYKTSKNIEITSDMERQAAFMPCSIRTNTRKRREGPGSFPQNIGGAFGHPCR